MFAILIILIAAVVLFLAASEVMKYFNTDD